MKTKVIILLMCIGVMACGKKQLTREEAMVLIAKERGYPRVIDLDIFTADPQHARRLLDANLEKEGFVIIQKTQKLGEVGNPLVSFTEKAKPYLLPESDEDKGSHIKKVKVGEKNIAGIRSITEDKAAGSVEVAYTTDILNTTPFAVLIKNISGPHEELATFRHDGERWVLVRNR